MRKKKRRTLKSSHHKPHKIILQVKLNLSSLLNKFQRIVLLRSMLNNRKILMNLKIVPSKKQLKKLKLKTQKLIKILSNLNSKKLRILFRNHNQKRKLRILNHLIQDLQLMKNRKKKLLSNNKTKLLKKLFLKLKKLQVRRQLVELKMKNKKMNRFGMMKRKKMFLLNKMFNKLLNLIHSRAKRQRK